MPTPKTRKARSGGQNQALVSVHNSATRDIKVVNQAETVNIFDSPARTGADPQSLRPYLSHLAQSFFELSDASIRHLRDRPMQTDRQLPRLAEVYVRLDTKPGPSRDREKASGKKSLPVEQQTRKSPQAIPALKRIAAHNRLVLLGLPGSGKTTLVKHLCLCLAKNLLEPNRGWLKRLECLPEGKTESTAKFSWPKRMAGLVPVFLELRKFADKLAKPLRSTSQEQPAEGPDQPDCERLKHFFEEQLRKTGLADTLSAVAEAIKAGQALVFLDGLDEVPTDELKRRVRDAVLALSGGDYSASRFVVTCRTVSYQDESWRLPNFEMAELERLDDEKIELFIQRFYAELAERGRIDSDVANRRVVSLSGAFQKKRELREMAGNPHLLSVMAQLHLRTELPAQRAALFEKFVEEILFEWEADKRRDAEGPPVLGLSEMLERAETGRETFRAVLSRLAFEAHKAHQTDRNPSQSDSIYIAEEKLRDALADLPPRNKFSAKERKAWAEDVIHLIEHRAGLLVGQGNHLFAMAFKLQEFMAATHLCDPDYFQFETDAAGLIADDGGYWEEVVRLAAGYQAHPKRSAAMARSLALSLCRLHAPSETVAIRRASLASQILYEIGINNVQKTPQGVECLNAVRQSLDRFALRTNLPAKPRGEALSARGWLEELPRGVGLDEKGMPLIDWIEIPAGPFVMGSKQGEATWKDEMPQFQCKLVTAAFRLSRYPVTVAQYQAFVDAHGYTDAARKWWTDHGWKWKQDLGITGPEDYEPAFQTPNHPRVGVSWFEAVAFCRWLSGQIELDIRLPSEAEWERAARHTDGRMYPWSDPTDKSRVDESLSQRCNMGDTGMGHTSAVGLFPNGLAQCGAADMAGNVLEWCQTKWRGDYREYEKKVDDELDGTDSRVLRGGSWGNVYPGRLRCSCRSGDPPDFRNSNLGFRCVWVMGASARG